MYITLLIYMIVEVLNKNRFFSKINPLEIVHETFI